MAAAPRVHLLELAPVEAPRHSISDLDRGALKRRSAGNQLSDRDQVTLGGAQGTPAVRLGHEWRIAVRVEAQALLDPCTQGVMCGLVAVPFT